MSLHLVLICTFVFSFIVYLMTLWFLNGFNSSIPLFLSSQNFYQTTMAYFALFVFTLRLFLKYTSQTHPFHWYFTSALPRSLLAAYPLFLVSLEL